MKREAAHEPDFTLTLIQANAEYIFTTLNLLCILKEWEFPIIVREFPKNLKADLSEIELCKLGEIVLI